ncbi:MAG: four helix bundle protein [Patescibacteria group bacterium]|jgi:four helix bundle protein
MGVLFESFEKMKVWQQADEVALKIYIRLRPCKDYGYKDQIQRAAVSVMNNIAEGFERGSKNSFINYLLIAKGSCGEVRSMLILGHQLGYFSETDYRELFEKVIENSRMLQGLVNSLNSTR